MFSAWVAPPDVEQSLWHLRQKDQYDFSGFLLYKFTIHMMWEELL